MSGLIHFVSGKTLAISELEFNNISPKLGAKGIRCQVSHAGHIIPLNSTTMEYIEHVEEEQEAREMSTETLVPTKEEEVPTRTEDEVMNDMLAKSNCGHENQTIHIQHTAKGVRYFPVCDFCGKRDRYISEKKVLDGEYPEWKIEDIDNAKPWIEG